MENLGCITFRENLLLVDPVNATQPERQLVADVVAHELAHVVRRPCHHALVERHLAQRSLCNVHGNVACDALKPEWGRWLTFGTERTVALKPTHWRQPALLSSK